MIDPLIYVKNLLENNWDENKYGPKPQIETLKKITTTITDKGIVYLRSIRVSVEPFGLGITHYSNNYTMIIDVWTKSRERLMQIIQAIMEILFKKTKESGNPFRIVVEGYEDFSDEVFGAQRGQLTIGITDYTPL